MHGLPDRSTLCIDTADSFQYFSRAAFPALRNKYCFPFSPHTFAHCFRLNDHTGQPVIGGSVHRIHLDRKSFQSFCISLIDFFLLRFMLFCIGQLSSDHSRYDIAHTVIISKLLMLIPWSIFPGLCTPFSDFFRPVLTIAEQHSSTGACDQFISVK